MKLEDVKHIIDKYFAETPAEDIIKRFEEMGVQFEDIDETSEKPALNIANVVLSCPFCDSKNTEVIHAISYCECNDCEKEFEA